MCGDPDEYADVYHRRFRKARKPHRCYACRETIRAEDYYQYTSGVFDGRGFDYKHCIRCSRTLNLLDEITGEPADIDLNCGQVYDGDNKELISMAFLTPDEGQEWVRGQLQEKR